MHAFHGTSGIAGMVMPWVLALLFALPHSANSMPAPSPTPAPVPTPTPTPTPKVYGCTTGSGTGCATCVTQAARTSATDCATCNAGYALSNKMCQAYSCTTGTGTGCATCVTQASRTSATNCATCNAGYALSNAMCQAYGCTTGTGTGCATCVTQASRTSATNCATCNAGYALSNAMCQATTTTTQATLTGNNVHTVKLSVQLPDLAGKTEAQVLDQIKQAIMSSTNSSSAKTQVTITHVNVEGEFSGVPSTFTTDQIIMAVANMVSVDVKHVTITDASAGQVTHSSVTASSGGRRLQTTQSVKYNVKFPNTNNDVVAVAHAGMQAVSAAAFEQSLKSNCSGAACTFTVAQVTAPSAKVAVKVVVEAATVPTASAIASDVASKTGGTIEIQEINNQVLSSTTNVEDSSAPIAPMMTIWALLYAMAMASN